MKQELKPFLAFLGAVFLLAILLGITYLFGDVSYIIALMLLFLGLSTDIFVSLKLIDKTLKNT